MAKDSNQPTRRDALKIMAASMAPIIAPAGAAMGATAVSAQTGELLSHIYQFLQYSGHDRHAAHRTQFLSLHEARDNPAGLGDNDYYSDTHLDALMRKQALQHAQGVLSDMSAPASIRNVARNAQTLIDMIETTGRNAPDGQLASDFILHIQKLERQVAHELATAAPEIHQAWSHANAVREAKYGRSAKKFAEDDKAQPKEPKTRPEPASPTADVVRHGEHKPRISADSEQVYDDINAVTTKPYKTGRESFTERLIGENQIILPRGK